MASQNLSESVLQLIVIMCEVPLSPGSMAMAEYIEVVAFAVVTSYVLGFLFVTCADMAHGTWDVTPNLIIVVFGVFCWGFPSPVRNYGTKDGPDGGGSPEGHRQC